jgi:phage-related protein
VNQWVGNVGRISGLINYYSGHNNYYKISARIVAIMPWKVYFFQTFRGDYPVKDFMIEQDKPTYAKLISAIGLLETDGPYLKPPYIKKLQNRLYELRISGKIAIRVFYIIKDGEYYLLHAFKKKTQKTPAKELQIALDRMKEFI